MGFFIKKMDLNENFELQVEDNVLQLYFSEFETQVSVFLPENNSFTSEGGQAYTADQTDAGLYKKKIKNLYFKSNISK